MAQIKNIIFDLGAVLIGWDPKAVFRTIFDTEEEVDWFLNNICTMDWNEQQDAGRPIKDATEILVHKFPEHKESIEAYYGRWEEMLTGAIQGTVDILENIIASNNYRVLALTNWSAETFPVAQARYNFLSWFEGIVVSGAEKCRKPEEKFYNILLDRYDLKAEECLFIDDNKRNILAAEKLGFHTILFKSPQQLSKDLTPYLNENS